MNFEIFKQKLFKNPEFKRVYEDKSDLYFETSEMVEEIRMKAGLTQAKLAEMIGTRQSSIARIEGGTTLPSLSFLKRIAEALDTYLIPPKFASLEMAESETKVVNMLFLPEGIYEIQGKEPEFKFSLSKAVVGTQLSEYSIK